MGCGSSSLKGDPVGNDLTSTPNVPVNTAPPTSKNALTKTATQFNSVDYDAERKKSTMPPDRAPHEQDSPHLPKSTTLPTSDEVKLEPYHTLEDPAAMGPGGQAEVLDHNYPHEHLGSNSKKDEETGFISNPDQLDAQTGKDEQDLVR